MKRRCLCPSPSHDHKARRCIRIAKEPDGLCLVCHEHTAKELTADSDLDRPLAPLIENEMYLKELRVRLPVTLKAIAW
jgi:hypothetical protein